MIRVALAVVVGLWPATGRPQEATPPARTLTITEFKVNGVRSLTEDQVQAALDPFLGPGKVLDDVEKARVALERAYSDRGFLAIRVAIPPQTVRGGVVELLVTEGTVGRLRVRGSRYYSLSQIKALAPSMAEGVVPNLNAIARDIVALNQLPDRRVTPELRAGVQPGTVDVDLKVQDTLPLHGAVELNNRYSNFTSPLRVSGWLSYDNFFQLGHALRFSFQVAPLRLSDAAVFALGYTARVPSVPWLSLVFTGIYQDSDIATVALTGAGAGPAVLGRGGVVNGRVVMTLPPVGQLFHSVNVGLDFKRFIETITLRNEDPTADEEAPRFTIGLTYWPVFLQYGATLAGDGYQVQAGLTFTANLRGLGNTDALFDYRRYKAPAGFFHLRADVTYTQALPGALELFFRANGQFAVDPLIPPEQLIVGGQESVRGYLEGQAAGDWGGSVSLELRSPWLRPFPTLGGGIIPFSGRLVVFGEGAWTRLWEPLPEQQSIFRLWSAGGGARLDLFRHLHGALDLAVPLRGEGPTARLAWRLLFRVWVDL